MIPSFKSAAQTEPAIRSAKTIRGIMGALYTMELHTPVVYLKGVGPARAAMLEAKGIFTIEDLLYYMPFRYEDRGNLKPIAQLAPGERATVVATLISARPVQFRRSAVRLFEVRAWDDSGGTL